ncbi:MAG TPA: GMP synthase (glutamine-hydrolyzing), partial [Candidatus Omnitrophica bacterium]|nr:GMP synthase (glutamine-hydrolyzing) [Candidatus Omnitrophota bacterium]
MQTIVVLDFGSQYTQLIARRVRENNVFSRILPYNASFEQILESNPEGIILSGSPASVYAKGAPMPDKRIFEAGIPILGICYGMQLLSHTFGGKVLKSNKREYGLSVLKTHEQKTLFKGIPKSFNCWMSHGDKVTVLPKGFKILANTANAPYAAMVHPQKQFYAIQFHAEV